jgi:hypothetical protein
VNKKAAMPIGIKPNTAKAAAYMLIQCMIGKTPYGTDGGSHLMGMVITIKGPQGKILFRIYGKKTLVQKIAIRFVLLFCHFVYMQRYLRQS